MSYNPFIFVKGYLERLSDFSSIFSSGVKATNIQIEWSNYVELAIEPVGWQAIWMISRDLCADLKINFPCSVIVVVERVDFKELSCLVSVNEVQGDIHLPNQMVDVPLIELFPTMEQDKMSALSLYGTAELVDSLRFFYNHLWMPWDLDFDEDISWPESHLEGRLQLHFALMERKIPHELAYTVRGLISEGRKARHQIEELLGEMDVEAFPSKLLQLTELHNRLCHLRDEYAIYEKPNLLKALLERKQVEEKSLELGEVFVYLVLSTTTAEHLLKLANLSKQLASEKKIIRILPSLQLALVKAPPKSLVWVTEGEHRIRNLAQLETGGSIVGVDPGVILKDEEEGCCAIELVTGYLSLSSLTLKLNTSWNIIKMRQGVECCLTEISLQGNTVVDGIDVFPGATLKATDCHFSNCHTAVIGDASSTIVLSRCSFTDNNTAIELKEGCNFAMENCSISGSKLYGVCVLVNGSADRENSNIMVINSIPQMKESGTMTTGNALDLCFLQSDTRKEINNLDL